MGWLSDLWSGIKNTASNIWSGVKQGVNWAADKVSPIVSAVQKYAGYVPIIGAPIAAAAGTVGNLINTAKSGVDLATKAGFKNGGMIMKVPDKIYQA